MRSLRLARIAAEAEGLRLRRLSQRTVARIVLGVVALVFLIAALAFAHVLLWFWLRATWSEMITASMIGAGDLLVAAVFALIASSSSPGRIEREALEVRQRALANAGSSLALTSLAVPALRLGLSAIRRRSA